MVVPSELPQVLPSIVRLIVSGAFVESIVVVPGKVASIAVPCEAIAGGSRDRDGCS